MNFEKIFHGMIGKDFIKAFNDNFTISDKTFLEILATLIYKVKSTDIKEFKVIDNVVSYTLEEAPTNDEEDTRTWTPVDITKWSNIQGNIQDQEDLWNILENKAALDTVQTMNNLLTTLNQDFSLLKDKVETNESTLRTNVNDTANLMEEITEKVNSTNIKAIRLNNAVFQWSPDGRTWYEQPLTTSIAWGNLTGDINTQEDLMHLFDTISNNLNELNTNKTSVESSLNDINSNISNIENTLNNHVIDYNEFKNTTNTSINTLTDTANSSKEASDNAKEALDNHLIDYDNPHHITKATVQLENVDNTSDADKPLSNAQKEYIDNQIKALLEHKFDMTGLLESRGLINKIFVGNESEYSKYTGDTGGMLAFILDDEFFLTSLALTTEKYTNVRLFNGSNQLTPIEETTTTKFYNNLDINGTYYVLFDYEANSSTDNRLNLELDFSGENSITIEDKMNIPETRESEVVE